LKREYQKKKKKKMEIHAHGWWFSPGTPASSTAKTDRHDIAEILLKVALKQQKSINQSIIIIFVWPVDNRKDEKA
jgi:hypothetical protein